MKNAFDLIDHDLLLSHEPQFDAMTGVLTHPSFVNELECVFDEFNNASDYNTVCYINIIRFKLINVKYGHAKSDELLKKFCLHFCRELDENSFMARLGGDKFGLILRNKSIGDAESIVRGILGSITSNSNQVPGAEPEIDICIGASALSGSVGQTVSRADLACKMARGFSPIKYCVYEQHANFKNNGDHGLVRISSLDDLLSKNEICLYAQPIADFRYDDNVYDKYEILARFKDSEGRILSPGQYITTAERNGFMLNLDYAIVRLIFEHIKDYYLSDRNSMYSINLSGVSISHSSFIEYVTKEAEKNYVTPEEICFEINDYESIITSEIAVEVMNTLKNRGFKFALSNFGRGKVAYECIELLPIDYLKLDKELVQNINKNKTDEDLVNSINRVASEMGIEVIAEFTESQEIIKVLKKCGINLAQGFAIARPIPITELSKIKIDAGES